jgi:hypothetical protein
LARSRVRRTSRWLVALPAGLAGAVGGYLFGLGAAAFASFFGGDTPHWLPLALAGIMGATAYLLWAGVIEGAGDLIGRLLMGADEGTAPEYSAAASHEMAGRYEVALAAYLEGAEQYPDDPNPLIQGARLLGEVLNRPEESLALLLRARAIPEIQRREANTVDRELVALYTGPLGQPQRALPILARMAEREAGTRPGEWAARTLAGLRTQVWEQVRDDPAESTPDYHRQVTGRHPDPPARPPHRD